MKKVLPLIITSLLTTNMAFAKSSFERDYDELKKYRFGSFTIDMIENLKPTKIQKIDGLDHLYFDFNNLNSLPLSRGFYPEMTLLTDQKDSFALYTAKFKTKDDCMKRIGQKEISKLYYKKYKNRAVKKSPADEVWVTYDGDRIEKKPKIKQSEYDLVTDTSFAKGYFNPLYPDYARTFSNPQVGDFYFELECKQTGDMKLMFKDVKEYQNIRNKGE